MSGVEWSGRQGRKTVTLEALRQMDGKKGEDRRRRAKGMGKKAKKK